MYEAFYKLANDPFRLLPDPGICFPHRSCAKAWAYLRYALQRGEGIVVVTGPPGSGKTTLAERLLNELNPAKTVSVRLIANDLNATDLLRKLAYSFGLPAEGMDRAMLAHRIESYLFELEHSQRRALVLIDEAQTLSHHSLEAMRLLTDLQSRSRPVLQLFLLGQEELEGVMCAPGMTQFQQRVIASSRLHPMDFTETKAYLEYRLGFADWAGDPSINGPAVMAIYRHSQGLPRHVNKICSRLLLHGCTEEKHALVEQDVLAVVQDLRDELLAPTSGEREAAATLEGSVFQSVYELALVPGSRSAKIANTNVPEVKDTLSHADEQGQQAVAAEPHQTRRETPRDDGRLDTPGRYFYGAGYSRPHQLLRRLHHMLRAPGGLVRRSWTVAVRGVSLLWQSVARAGRKVGVPAGGGARRVNEMGMRVPREFVPGAVVAGLGVLLVLVLAFGMWNTGGNTETSLEDERTVETGQVSMPGTGIGARLRGVSDPAKVLRHLDVAALVTDTAELAGQGLLDTSIYRDLAASPAPAIDENGVLRNVETTASTGAVDVGLSANFGGLNVGQGNLVIGKLSGDAADGLVGWAAQAGNSLDSWVLAWSPQDDWPIVGVQAETVTGSVVSASREGRSAVDAHADPAAPGPFSEDANDGVTLPAGVVLPGAGPIEQVVSDHHEDLQNHVSFLPAEDPGQLSADVAIAQHDPEVESGLVAADKTISLNLDESGQMALSEKEAEVQKLLALAGAAMAVDQLTLPAEGSAYSYFQGVLEIDAENEFARAGISDIVSRYADLAGWALNGHALDKAELYVGRALQIEPGNTRMLALRDEVEDAIAKAQAAELAEAEQARLALEMRQAAPTVEPVVDQESNFSRLMRFVDGFQADRGN